MLALMPFFHCDLSVDRILMLYGCDSDFVLHVRCMLSLETPEAEPEARQNFVKLVASEAEDCAVAGDAFYFDSRQTSVVIYSNGNVAYLFAVVYYDNGVLVERPFFPVGPQQAYANGEPGILFVHLHGNDRKRAAYRAVDFIMAAEVNARKKGAGYEEYNGPRQN